MVILTALLSASNARRSDMISAVAPPSFCLKKSHYIETDLHHTKSEQDKVHAHIHDIQGK